MYKWFVDVQAQGAQLGQTAASYQPAADQGARTRDEETRGECLLSLARRCTRS